jgi:branched-chain amino acid transport system substrate-binding protein
MNDKFVAESIKRYNTPPDLFSAGGFVSVAAILAGIQKAGTTDTEKLIAAMEGMSFDTPKGTMTFRKEDHQAMQSQYVFRTKKAPGASEWDVVDLVREVPAAEMPVPLKVKAP